MIYAQIAVCAEEIEQKVIELRRDFHAHPELPWKEVETSKKIEEILRSLGYENIRRGFGGTESGVVADITGKADGPTLALRADIDALPLQEDVDVPWRSTCDGVMHACGHDAHAAILLGVAHILASLKEQIPGRVRLIFQPAEESGVRSGAKQLIEEGALDGVDAIGGLHVWSPLQTGKVGFRKGAMMASADIWDIYVKGRGGHGSRPHEAVDPTIAAATMISTVQTIVSREIDPLETVVVSVGKLESGTAPNIIPETAHIQGNIRTTSPVIRDSMEGRLRRIAGGIASALRCEAKVAFTPVYPVTVNNDAMADMLLDVVKKVKGEESYEEVAIVMGSEDFSFYQQKVPGVFCFLGMGDPAKGSDAQHHSPQFQVNEDVLKDGVILLSSFAFHFFQASSC
ncbi:M20 metallopeptidase family protein [Aminobacterium mobile]|uniref:M20 metallopeptidase family protein n=1 Tax=Aminobacterium mobile TaxID=81467 RepID=UPI003314F93F